MKTLILLFILPVVSGLHAGSEFEHYVVYQREGRFAAWPANNGAWIFEGDEILVGFTEGLYKLQEGHNIGPESTHTSWLARSRDGGKTWRAYDPEGYVGDYGEQPYRRPVVDPIHVEAPQFALRMVGTAYHGAYDPRGHFFYSYDAGDTWMGPHGFGEIRHHPELEKYGLTEITPRTDYIVLGEHEALLMMSARLPDRFGTDRLFVVRTNDGGRSFFFLSWIVPPYDPEIVDTSDRVQLFEEERFNPHPSRARAVMPQSFLTPEGSIVTALRRRYQDETNDLNRNWVDAYVSHDEGRSWEFLATVGDAGSGNGNPPALNMTADGRLCAVFGDRAAGQMMVAYSADLGRSWEGPIVLRDDFWSEDMETNDLGYPRLLRRSDGKMVAVYYYSTRKNKHGIFATIWDPAAHR